jgi:hypothetical protein
MPIARTGYSDRIARSAARGQRRACRIRLGRGWLHGSAERAAGPRRQGFRASLLLKNGMTCLSIRPATPLK